MGRRNESGMWEMGGQRRVMGGKWGQLELNNNKKNKNK